MFPRVSRARQANVFYNTGHGHLGWTLSAVTADMIADVVAQADEQAIQVGAAPGNQLFPLRA